MNQPTRLVDPRGLAAGGFGLTASAAAVLFLGGYIEGSVLGVADTKGNYGVLVCTMGGPVNGVALAAGLQGTVIACPNCESICDLEGGCAGYVVGFAKGVGLAYGGSGCISSSGWTLSFSIGMAQGLGIYAGPVLGACKLVKKAQCC